MVTRTTEETEMGWGWKQLYEYFKRQTDEISHGNIWTWLRKGQFKRGTESLLLAYLPNNARKTNYFLDKNEYDAKE